jgi:transposase
MSQSSQKPPRKAKQPSAGNALTLIHADAAGLDIGASEIYGSVPADRDAQPVRKFATFTADLHQLAQWLVQCQIKTVAMESTGVYWVPVFEILEAYGIEVYLVDARQLKQVPGRKSDVNDCQWLQQLHSFGLLRRCFQADEEMRALPILVRHREMLIRNRSTHILHMQKALQMMNLQLTQVVSDITGQTGLRIIRAILAGERDPQQLAQLRNVQCARTVQEIARALEGSYKTEHLFTLRQAVELYDFYGQQIAACDQEMERLYVQITPPPDETNPPSNPPPAPSQQRPRKNQANFDLKSALFDLTGVDLTAVPGLDALTVQSVLGEIGTDMSHWPTVKHFCSWLGLAPRHEKSGGKLLRNRTLKSANRANTALRVAAQAVARSSSAIGAFFRRIKAKHGPAKAIVATAHKLARIIYFMLRDRTPYVDLGADYYTEQQQANLLRYLNRKAKSLGMVLMPNNSDEHSLPVSAT